MPRETFREQNMPQETIIELVNVGFQYVGSEKTALKNISLSIKKARSSRLSGTTLRQEYALQAL